MHAFAVWRRNFLVWRKLMIPSLLGNFGEPLLYLLALGYGLGAFVGEINGMSYLAFLSSGMVASSAMMTASFEGTYSAYSRMATQRTWDAMRTAPLDIFDVVLGEALWAASKSLINSLAILIVASALGAVALTSQLLFVIPVVLLTGLAFAAIALIVTAFARSYDFFLYHSTLLITPMILLSGVYFPLDNMPGLIQTLAYLLPLAHAVELIRPLMTDQPAEAWPLHLAVLGSYAGVTLALATWLFQRRLAS